MAGQRFLPLIIAVLCGTALLIARLFQVQIVERDIWAEEAANLVRSGNVLPYRRGSIVDARGRVLAHDEVVYRVVFNYRDFRRGHPLALVAHARSALFGTPIGLAETLENLPQWTEELALLTPADLADFARGEPMSLGSTVVAGTNEPERTDRRARRSDVRFYIAQLFEFDRGERVDFAELCKQRVDDPLIVLAAKAKGVSDVEMLRQRLAERSLECSEDLAHLAAQLELDARSLTPSETPELSEIQAKGARIETLVARLEERRLEVEDDCGSALFAEAFGFPAGRIEPEALFEAIDLEWIASLLGWDAARTSDWLAGARRRMRESLMRGRIERLVAELEVSAADGELPSRILERWAEPFVARREQLALEGLAAARDLVVLADLDALFEGRAKDDPAAEDIVLPFQAARWRDVGAALDWSGLSELELGAGATAAEIELNALAWSQAFEDGFARDFLLERTRGVFARWEQDLQRALRAELQRRLAATETGGRLRLIAARLDRASERARYILKDRGSRPQVLARDPSYATVLLLTRHRDRFAGLRVEDATERVRTLDARGIAIADGLIGRVGGLTLRESLLEGSLRTDFDELRRKAERTDEEDVELRWMARRLVRDDEDRGRSGIEAYFDVELAGRNGYREVRGYQELIDGATQVDVPPQDGSDVVLTLDLDLQAAATAVFTAPEADPNPISNDYEWLTEPTAAMVLMTVTGDVLAAVSYPDFVRDESSDAALRDLPFERTLRKPTFQPPGSCFKPFVAAWALEHGLVDPSASHVCGPMPGRSGAGYVDVRCNATYGHGGVDLRDALKQSCNAYFAHLGESFGGDDWRNLAAEFGFGRATGLRAFGDRGGLMEDRFGSLFSVAPQSRSARLAGNGLAVVEATPMQVARATAALATGVLPDVRLVKSVGSVETPSRSRPLSFSPSTLSAVRDAMLAVAEERGGSAEPALNSTRLGFRIGAKTGSADIGSIAVIAADGRERVRKHAWLIGFFPYEEPRYVVVVFCHDTLATASHNAIWLAHQFLTTPAVQTLMSGGGR